MRKMILIFIMMGVMTFTFPLNVKSYSESSKPKLDCHKMVSKLIKAIEARDIKTICSLAGSEYPENAEHLNKRIDDLYTRWPSFVEELYLFPEIGELPEWLTFIRFGFVYIKDNYEIRLRPEFNLKDDAWIITDIDLGFNKSKLKWTARRSISRSEISPPPPEGKKTLDAGLNDIMKKLVSDFKEKNWDSIKQYAPIFNDPKRMSELKTKGKKFGELLSQFPTIGPIPAPAMSVRVRMKGKLGGESVRVEVRFRWKENNTLIIDAITVAY